MHTPILLIFIGLVCLTVVDGLPCDIGHCVITIFPCAAAVAVGGVPSIAHNCTHEIIISPHICFFAYLLFSQKNDLFIFSFVLCSLKLKGRIKGNSGTCSKCKKGPSGGLISCSKDGCNAMFHPTCGQRSGGSAMRGPHLHPSAWKARCRKHAEPRPTENPGYIPATSRMPIKDMYK